MELSLLNPLLSLIFLLAASCIAFIFSKKINFPYTVMLVLVWILLVPLIKMWHLTFIRDFKLTPDMLFFIFLPILIFESAYNMNYKDLLKNSLPVFSLAIVWLIISVLVISSIMFFSLWFLGVSIPFIVCLLFWAIISATDTVAVLSLFKSVWAPKRLIGIFEWESLFNDWTAIALFLVILWIISESQNIDFSVISGWILSFLSMFFGWILFWAFTWVLFSKIIEKIKNNESVEITLTMILAHLTFIIAELIKNMSIFWHNIHISWVIATAVAAIVMGNYGRYKISPKVEEYMEKFWWFFAFIANSLVFILLWLILSDIKIDLFNWFIIIAFIAIASEIISRALSVYIPINLVNSFKITKKIPASRQHIFAWASPRWALSVMMLIMIPSDLTVSWWNMPFSVQDFLTLTIISTIMFSLFVKVPTVPLLIKKLKLNKLNRLEELELELARIIIFLEDIEKLKESYNKWNIGKIELETLKNKFQKRIENSRELVKAQTSPNRNNIIERAISLSALSMQKKYLIELLTFNEIDERNFKHLLVRFENKIKKLENAEDLVISDSDNYTYNFFEKWTNIFRRPKESDRFIRNRARKITIKKVLKELNLLKKIDFWFDSSHFDEVISIYNTIYENIKKETSSNDDLTKLENNLFEKSLLKTTANTINELRNKWIIDQKLYDLFSEKIEDRIYNNNF